MNRTVKYISFIVFLLFFEFTFANKTEKINFEYPYKQFTSLDGLSSNETYFTFKDTDGYIWISTDKGVSRFNGYEFENFTTADGLIDNTIFQIEQDHKGRIWFVGFNTKLCYYENNTFHEYKYNKLIVSHNELDYYNSVDDFSIDEKDNVFIGFYGYGYVIINDKGEVLEKKSSKSRDFINGENFEAENGSIVGKKYFNGKYRDYKIGYISERTNNVYLAINDTIIKTFSNLKLNYHDNVCDIKRNTSDLKSLKTFIVEDSFMLFKQINLIYSKNITRVLPKNEFSKIFYVNNSFIKVDHSGIWVLDSELNNKYLILNLKKAGVDIYNITSIQGIEGNLWINTNINGVYLIPNYENPNTKNYNIPNKAIAGIIKINDTVYFKGEMTSSSFTLDKDDYLIEVSEELTNMHTDIKGDYSFYGKTSFKNITQRFKCISVNNRTFFSDRQKIFEYIDGEIVIIVDKVESNIFSLIQYNNQLLVGTQNGIFYLNEENELSRFTIPNYNLDINRIQDMKLLNNLLVIATRGSGIYISNGEKTKHLSVKEGLASNIINQIFVDDKKYLWVATNNGANSISVKDLYNIAIVQHINLTYGIISPDIRQIYVDKNKVYLACDIGLSVVKYRKTNTTQALIPVFFTSLKFNDQIVIKNRFNDTIISYEDNSILFSYTGVTPIYANNLIYRYKLIGLDDDWDYTKDRIVSFNSLKPGNYTFIVQAKSDRNNWSKVHPEFNFKITRPFWRSPFFFIYVFVFLAIATYKWLDYYTMSEKNRAKLQKELNKAKQASLNAQMNPHFVFNSLNSIQSFILKNDRDSANKYLVKFSKLIRSIFENSKNHYVSLEDELSALTLYLDLEQMRFDKSFSYEINIDPIIDKETCTLPSLLIQPFVENAIWHGINHKETGIGFIKIEINIKDDDLIISIEDNGVGYDFSKQIGDENSRHESSGIAITKKRLSLVNELENNNYTCEIINLTNEENKSTGTLIKFTIPYLLNANEDN